MARNHNFNSHGYSSHGGGGTGGRGRNNRNQSNNGHNNNHLDHAGATYRREQQYNDHNQYGHHVPYNRYHRHFSLNDPYLHSGRPSFRGKLNSVQNEEQHQLEIQDTQVAERTINPPRSTHPAGTITSASKKNTVAVEYDTEWNRRTRTVEQLINLPSLNERLAHFQALPNGEQLILFFSEDWSPESLPPLQEPAYWLGKIQNALQTCVKRIPELFYSDEQMDDDDDVDPADEMYAPPPNNSQQYARSFVSGLPYCHPLLAGFHVLPLLSLAGKGTMCYCPCSQRQRMDRWQRFFLPESMLDDPITFRCTFHGPKSPHELYKHIADLASNCNYHKLLQTFLLTAFADYHKPGMRHIELENKGDFKHKEAQAFVAKEIKKQVDALAREAEKMREYEQKLAELKDRQTKLETTNRDLAEQLKAERKLKEQLNAKGETDFNDSQLQRAKTIFERFKIHVRQSLEDACPKPKFGEISIVIDQPINVVDLFDRLHSSHVGAKTKKPDFAFLFDSLMETDQTEERRRVIMGWTAILNQSESTETILSIESAIAPDSPEDQDDNKSNILREKDELQTLRPKDEGGPTRLFFSRAWDQIGNLEVQTVRREGGKKLLKLFSSSRGGLLPEQDATIAAFCDSSEDPNVVRAHVKAYYTAFGRLLAHAILLGPENKGPITIGMSVLPDLLKNVLFRGLNVSDDAYLLGDVIDHMGGVMNFDIEPDVDRKEYGNRVRRFLGLDSSKSKSIQSKSDLRKKLRETAQEEFIDTRKEVLEWIQDGLSIGGRVDWSTCLASVPTKSLIRLLGFSQQKIRYESVFDELGKFRFIRFATFSNDNDNDLVRFRARQELFKTNLANWFKKKMKEDETYISNFVYFCTGSKYIPDIDLNPAWFITVEFNLGEMIRDEGVTDAVDLDNAFVPAVHTCDNCIKIPAHAYDCNMEVFEQKLNVSMKQTLESFDMT